MAHMPPVKFTPDRKGCALLQFNYGMQYMFLYVLNYIKYRITFIYTKNISSRYKDFSTLAEKKNKIETIILILQR